MSCSCQSSVVSEESDSSFDEKKLTDPTILAFKKALTDLTPIIKAAKNSSDGKELGDGYWEKVSKLLKKAKLGIAMFELGLDGEGDIEDADAEGIDIKPMGDTRDGDEQFDKEEEEKEKEAEEKEKEAEEGEKEKDSKEGEKKKDSEEEEKEKDSPESKKENVQEAATSASQQRLFGMVYALKKGELKKDSVTKTLWEKIKKIADGVSLKDAKDFAKTKHSDLPERIPATESKEQLLDQARHLGIILESEGSKIKSLVYFNSGLVVEVSRGDRIHCMCMGKQVSLEGVEYSIVLGDKTDFGIVAEKFNKFSETPEGDLKYVL